MDARCELGSRRCQPCEGGVPPLSEEEIAARLSVLPDWVRDGGAISRAFRFRNHHETMAFVNAVAWISHRTDHHPELTVGYADCRVRYWTHAIGGLSENDFICAARVDGLLEA